MEKPFDHGQILPVARLPDYGKPNNHVENRRPHGQGRLFVKNLFDDNRNNHAVILAIDYLHGNQYSVHHRGDHERLPVQSRLPPNDRTGRLANFPTYGIVRTRSENQKPGGWD